MPLYYYGELPFEAEERFEEHITGCGACRDELERYRRMAAALDQREQAGSPELLDECRQNLFLSLTGEQAPPLRRTSAWGHFRAGFAAFAAPLSAWRQPVGALALVALGFFSARFLQTTPRPVAPAASPEVLISTVRSVQPGESGTVEIAFDETRRRMLTGRIEDLRVQQLLMAAMRQESNPGVRVETMSVLKNSAVPSGIRDVLLYALQNDPNPGVRLKAIESLRSFADQEPVRRALAQVLLKDDNPGVRIQTIDLLVQHKDDSMVGVLQELVDRENNQYIRMRMAKALEDMNASVGTF
jgi:anti-sigma factor RsiW